MRQPDSVLPPEPLCIDRAAERRRIGELWEQATPGRPLRLAIGGPRGIGKSVLLTTLAYTLREHFDRVLYFDDPSDDPRVVVKAHDVAGHLLYQMEMDWQQIPEPGLRNTALRSRIGGQRVLIVLDGMESVGQVLPWLGDLSRAAVLVGCTGDLMEWQTSHFEPVRLGKFGPDDGVELLRRTGGTPVAHTDASVLERLVRALAGHPTLLVVAAAHLALGDESVEDYVTWLEGADADEMAGEITLGAQSVVRMICDSAYRDLTPEEQAAYRCLAAIPLSLVDTALAAAVLRTSDRTAKRLVSRLVEHTPVHRRGVGFFEYPHVARQDALKKLAGFQYSGTPWPDRQQVEARTFEWCVPEAIGLVRSLSPRPIEPAELRRIFDAIEPAYPGDSGPADATAEFARLWPLFVSAAVAATERGRYFEAAALWLAMWPFGYQTVRTSELIDGYSELLRVADDSEACSEVLADPALRWQICRDVGALHERLGETDAAWEMLDRSVAAGYLPGTASSLEWQAITLEQMDRRPEGLAKLQSAWAAVAWMEDPWQQRRSYDLLRMHRGRMLAALDQRDEAEADLLAAERALRQREQDRHNAALCRILLGDIAFRRRRFREAEVRWESTPEALESFGMHNEAANVHSKLAELAELENRPVDAESRRQRARELADGGWSE